jgi:probable rRNA maturation factor
VQLTLDIDGWEAPQCLASTWEALAQEAASAVGGCASELAKASLEVSLVLTTDAEVQALNREWRDKDKPTNVLSFPMVERDELLGLPDDGPPVLLGDIALARETCAREAAEKQVPLEHHAAHLIIHGFLHLAGYDHVTSEADAAEMEHLEVTALAKLGIADPYGDRV